jgi:HlyD family secretion protein
VRRIEAALDFSRQELRRAEALRRTDTIPEKALDKARFDVDTNEAALSDSRPQCTLRQNVH